MAHMAHTAHTAHMAHTIPTLPHHVFAVRAHCAGNGKYLSLQLKCYSTASAPPLGLSPQPAAGLLFRDMFHDLRHVHHTDAEAGDMDSDSQNLHTESSGL
jgi:hypothetical protein